MANFDTLLQKQITRKEFLGLLVLVFASMTGVTGLIRELQSRAATPTASFEPEKGTISGATIATDSAASGGEAIRFGSKGTYTRPTGPGYYAIEDLGVGVDLQAALAKVGTLTSTYTKNGGNGKSLTLPEGTFQATDFSQGRVISGSNYQGFTFLAPHGVGLVGSGPGTIIQTTKNSMTVATAQTIKGIPDLDNNNFYTICFNHADYCEIGQFTMNGVSQNTGSTLYPGLYYNGLRDQYSVNSRKFNIWVKGYGGYLNSPPGETYAITDYSTNGAVWDQVFTDGRDPDTNGAVSAIGIALTAATNTTLNNCQMVHTAASHGFVAWHCNGIALTNCTSQYTGTGAGAGGGGGTSGAAFNFESTQNTRIDACTTGNNTFCTVRYYSDGSVVPDTTGHYINALNALDGKFIIDIGNKQTTRPIITNSPSATFEALGY